MVRNVKVELLPVFDDEYGNDDNIFESNTNLDTRDMIVEKRFESPPLWKRHMSQK